jgi:hypothetical protein
VIVKATREFGWYTSRTGYEPGPAARGIAALDAQGVTQGMVVFDDWTPSAARMHIAVDTVGAGRALLRSAFYYLFQQAGKAVAFCIVPSGAKSEKLAHKL